MESAVRNAPFGGRRADVDTCMRLTRMVVSSLNHDDVSWLIKKIQEGIEADSNFPTEARDTPLMRATRVVGIYLAEHGYDDPVNGVYGLIKERAEMIGASSPLQDDDKNWIQAQGEIADEMRVFWYDWHNAYDAQRHSRAIKNLEDFLGKKPLFVA